MTSLRFSTAAEADLEGIIDYTIETWSFAQARRYVSGLTSACARIAEMPGMGKAAAYAGPGVRSFLYESHVVYYRPDHDGIVIVAVLHARQDPALRFDNDG